MIIRAVEILYRLCLLLPAFLLAACSGAVNDPRLYSINESLNAHHMIEASMQDSMIQSALSQLQEMQPASLSGQDRHLRDLLIVKASDKGYITHSSDSLILDVVNYFSHHKNSRFYPEALYYAGRVYSDLGDFPTALRYYQDALDALHGNTSNLQLKGNITSQTARLLNMLGLHDRAVPYLKKVIEINNETGDSINLMYNLQLLGAAHLHCDRYDTARKCFTQAYEISRQQSPIDTPLMKMYLAATSHFLGDDVQAKSFIKGVPESIEPTSHNLALVYASKIYLKSEELDSAYMYSRQLALSHDSNNKIIGYRIMLSPSLRKYISSDSLEYFLAQYKTEIDDEYASHQSQATALQDALYNYRQHEIKREKAEETNNKLKIWLYITGIVSLMFVIALLWLRNVHQHTLLKLQTVLINVKKLREPLMEENNLNPRLKDLTPSIKSLHNEKSLQEEVRAEILSLVNPLDEPVNISSAIIDSQAYLELQDLIINGKAITESSLLWDKIEKTISESSPLFNLRISLMSGNNLRDKDRRIAYLIKCGITPTHMASLLALSAGAITYRKYELSKRLFGQKLDLRVLDKIIRLL